MKVNSAKNPWLIGLVGLCTIFGVSLTAKAEFINAPKPVDGVVSASDVNVRVAPNKQIITTLNAGSKVKIIASDGEWLKIAVPADAKAYIASNMIENGKTKSNVNVRSGPGVEFPSYGILPKNSAVAVQPLPGQADWSKVEVPDSLNAYVFAKFVKFEDFTKKTDDGNKGGSEVKDGGKDAGKDAGKDVGSKNSDSDDNASKNIAANRNAFERLRDSFVPGTKSQVNISGQIYRLKTPSHGIEYVIYVTEKGNNKPYAYAYMYEIDKLRNNEAKTVKIKGERVNVRGWSLPVVEISEVK